MKLSILACLALCTFVIAAPAPVEADDADALDVTPNPEAEVLSAAVCGPFRGICVGWPIGAGAKRRRCAK
jgi:hypothetical protein